MIKEIFAAAILAGCLAQTQSSSAQTENTMTQKNKINVILVGDSTVADYKPELVIRGWGQVIPRFFNDDVKIINKAISGRSTKTFIQNGDWEKTLKLVKPGDYVLIQFGHNDSHAKDKPESTDAGTNYTEFLRKYVDDVRAAQATPILITPMHRGTFNKGVITAEMQPYADAMKKVAKEKDAVFIDLYTSSGKFMQDTGSDGLAPFFCAPKDRTHFSEKGAVIIAELIVKDLSAAKTPLAGYLKK
jgi:lysophospholipase L1-like esterase